MDQKDFIKHACEQALRFSKARSWDDLSEESKVQLGFNMGAMALGLSLSKEDGFLALANLRTGVTTTGQFREHIMKVVDKYRVHVEQAQIDRPF